VLDPLHILIALMLLISVALLVWSLFAFPIVEELPVHRRMAAALGQDRRETVFEQPLLKPIMNLALQLSRRMSFPLLRDMVRKNLNASGNPSSYSVDEYVAICLALGFVFAVVSGLFALALVGQLDPLVAVFMGAVGFVGPLYTLREASRNRTMRIGKKLPYTLDLVALTMGSGSTFTEAIDTVIADEPEDDFNQELKIVQAEVELGAKRAEALKNLAERIPLDSLHSVVGAINQAETLGTPLSTILSIQAQMMRMHRSVRAEKLAVSASLRILIPSMLILIAVVLVVFAPAILSWVQDGLLPGL